MTKRTTSIEWTERTWNPLRGCSAISPGCLHCYAARIAVRFAEGRFKGYVRKGLAGPQWTGKVSLLQDKLREPLGWKDPQMVFANSMSDAFHEDLPEGDILAMLAVMGNVPQHTFQVLTKRSARLRKIAADNGPFGGNVRGQAFRMGLSDLLLWPLPNVWLGVSVESGDYEFRIEDLLHTAAAVRFLSIEPQIGPVNLSKWLGSRVPWTGPAPESWDSPRIDWPEWVPSEAKVLTERMWSRSHGGRSPADYRAAAAGVSGSDTHAPGPLLGEHVVGEFNGGRGWFVRRSRGHRDEVIGRWVYGSHGRGWIVYPDGRVLRDVQTKGYAPPPRIDWVIVGGESGPKSRPFSVSWARDAKDACENAGVAYFLKQVGKRPIDPIPGDGKRRLILLDQKGGDPDEWPEDLRLRQWPAKSLQVARAIRLLAEPRGPFAAGAHP